mgnify:CR=1 FL=1
MNDNMTAVYETVMRRAIDLSSNGPARGLNPQVGAINLVWRWITGTNTTLVNVYSYGGVIVVTSTVTAGKIYDYTHAKLAGVFTTFDGTTYNAPPNTIDNGDSHLTALFKLASKFAPATGHNHDDDDGSAAGEAAWQLRHVYT